MFHVQLHPVNSGCLSLYRTSSLVALALPLHSGIQLLHIQTAPHPLKGQVIKVTFVYQLTTTGLGPVTVGRSFSWLSTTTSSLSTCMETGDGLESLLLLLLLLLLLTTDEAGEGGRHWEQFSSLTGVPARRLKSDSTAADVLLSRTLS